MISVCVPVFNADVRELTESLVKQAGDLEAEIILIDDCSQEKYRNLNRDLQGEMVKYHELEKNIGRARIRNRFTEYALNENLLFLDCDTLLISGEFLMNYVKAMNEFPEDIICGGSIYQSHSPGRNKKLHWKYGIRKESQPASIRNLNPGHSFMTGNFLIPLQMLKEFPFDERLTGYGHEDSLFGYEISCKGKRIIHIDNPVMHAGIETNAEFVHKTSEAVKSLVLITEMLGDDPGFIDSINLLKTAKKLESSWLYGFIRAGSCFTNPIAAWMLSQGFASLKLLDLYKLGLSLRIKNKRLPGLEQPLSDS